MTAFIAYLPWNILFKPFRIHHTLPSQRRVHIPTTGRVPSITEKYPFSLQCLQFLLDEWVWACGKEMKAINRRRDLQLILGGAATQRISNFVAGVGLCAGPWICHVDEVVRSNIGSLRYQSDSTRCSSGIVKCASIENNFVADRRHCVGS